MWWLKFKERPHFQTWAPCPSDTYLDTMASPLTSGPHYTHLSTVSIPHNTGSLFGEHTSAVVLHSPIRWRTSCWLHAWHPGVPGKGLITDGMNKGGGLMKRTGLYGSTTSVLKQKSCESYSQGYDFLNCVHSASLPKMEEDKIDSNQIWRKPRRIIRGERNQF